MENENRNVQTQSSSSEDVKADVKQQSGPTQEQVAELERKVQGLIGEAQKQRERAQKAEAQIPSPATQQDVNPPAQTNDEVGNVVNPYIQKGVQPLQKQVSEMQLAYEQDRAISILAQKSGKSTTEVRNDNKFLQELDEVAKSYNIAGSLSQQVSASYDIWSMKQGNKQTQDQNRANAISQQTTMDQGVVTTSHSVDNSFVISRTEFNDMKPAQYAEYEKKGYFKKEGDDKFVFYPNNT